MTIKYEQNMKFVNVLTICKFCYLSIYSIDTFEYDNRYQFQVFHLCNMYITFVQHAFEICYADVIKQATDTYSIKQTVLIVL